LGHGSLSIIKRILSCCYDPKTVSEQTTDIQIKSLPCKALKAVDAMNASKD
jgi:hypothetical protein